MTRKLTSNDVAAMLETTPDQVNLLARKGLLTGAKLGKRWKFNRRDVSGYRRRKVEQS